MKNKKTKKLSKLKGIKYFRLKEYKADMSDLIFHRIFCLLSSGEFDIILTTKTHGEAGYIDYDNYSIYLNPKVFPVEETLIHEVLHILKPKLDEKTIIEMSSLMFERLSDNKRDKLIAYIKALATKYVGIDKNDLCACYT
jgi:hypothetical protein